MDLHVCVKDISGRLHDGLIMLMTLEERGDD